MGGGSQRCSANEHSLWLFALFSFHLTATNERLFNISIVLPLQTCVCIWDLCSPRAPGCLQHQMSSCQRQSKSGKRAGRTSEERPAARSSAISARESSYKKHLLHFVLSMMLWKINTVMVFLPLFSLSSPQSLWVSICVHANARVASLVCFRNRNMQLNKYHYTDV